MKTDKKTYHEEQEALKKDAPTLFSLDKADGITVPDCYFEILEEQIEQQALPLQDGFEAPQGSLERLENAILHHTTGTQPAAVSKEFDAPNDRYFDRLEDAVLSQTSRADDATAVNTGKVRVLRMVSRFAIGVAAAVLIWLVAAPLLESEKTECKTFSCLLKETELSDEELLMLYDDGIVNELLPEEEGFEYMITEDEAMDYLLESELELNELLENETL